MRLSDLADYGISERVIDLWRERQGEALLPVQKAAIKHGLLGLPGAGSRSVPTSMVISAPTSSGKSFCAEMAVLKALTARKRVVVVCPMKALAEQQYADYSCTFGPLGIRALIVTGDHPENDLKFRQGEFDLAIVINEKLDLYLTDRLDHLQNLGLIVIDEIQTIAEPGRGAVLERMLTKVRASVYSPTILGLSAVIGDTGGSAHSLSDWLGGVLVEESQRPVDLRLGVAVDDSLKTRSFNTGLDLEERFGKSLGEEGVFGRFLGRVKASDGSTLVFLKSRRETIEAAFRLAGTVSWPPAETALHQLEHEESSYLVRSLRQALGRGVGFHNSDLSSKQRTIVEQAFRKKEVRALFSTTTLAMGVNLSADTVYLETVKYSAGVYGDRAGLVPVTKAEFDNMTGRAGRFNASEREGAKSGYAIVMAQSEFDRDILWRSYIVPEKAEPIGSAFTADSTANWLLNMITCGLLTQASVEAAESLYESSWSAKVSNTRMPMAAGLDLLVESGLIVVEESSRVVRATALGRAISVAGLTVERGMYFIKQLESAHPGSESGWLGLALSTPDFAFPPGLVNRYEVSSGEIVRSLYRQADHLVEAAKMIIGERAPERALSFRQAAGLKGLMLLDEFRQLAPVEHLEQKYQMHLGQITSLGESTSHLLLGIGSILKVSREIGSHVGQLSDLAFSVRHGMPSELRALHSRLGRNLNRSDFGALRRFNLVEEVSLREHTQEELAVMVGNHKAKYIKEQYEALNKEVDMHTGTSTVGERFEQPARPGLEPDRIEVIGSPERERFLVRINGFPVPLTGKSFKYFVKLAWSRMLKDSGWIYKEDIEIGFNQARYLYRMKNEINSFLNFPWAILENNRLGYYRLKIDPSKISVDRETLSNHPDFEVRELVSVSGGPALH